jgi:hypothetical protein
MLGECTLLLLTLCVLFLIAAMNPHHPSGQAMPAQKAGFSAIPNNGYMQY